MVEEHEARYRSRWCRQVLRGGGGGGQGGICSERREGRGNGVGVGVLHDECRQRLQFFWVVLVGGLGIGGSGLGREAFELEEGVPVLLT